MLQAGWGDMFLKKFFSDILGNITTSPVHLTSDKWLKYFLIKNNINIVKIP